MINIKSIQIRNFRSFGDYDTTIDLEKLGPVLITGEIDSDGEGRSKKRNGAGKTSIIDALVWALFGRTYDDARPGDSIINHAADKNCIVSVKTSDGYTITRTRKFHGKNELELHKDDEDKTLSTNTAAQKEILKVFRLDYGVFSSAVFFEQRAKPLLELKPVERRRILESILQINKINHRADSAKAHLKKETDIQGILLKEKELLDRDVDKFSKDLEEAKERRSEFENSRLDRIMELDKKIGDLTKEQDDIRLPDVEDIKKKWNLIDQVESKKKQLVEKKNAADLESHKSSSDIKSCHDQIEDLERQLLDAKDIDIDNLKALWNTHSEKLEKVVKQKENIDKIEKAIYKLDTDIRSNQSTIDNWHSKSGKECPTCKQNISEEHTKGLIKPYNEKLVDLTNKRRKLKAAIDQSEEKLEDLKKEAEHNKPEMTVEHATLISSSRENLKKKISHLNGKIGELIKVRDEKDLESRNISQVLEKIESKIISGRPDMTVKEAELVVQKHERLSSIIADAEREKAREKSEGNPHTEIIARIEQDKSDTEIKCENLKKDVTKKDLLIKHYNYIFKAYNDKKKIKSMILSGMIPVLNDRLRYYLDQFGFDVVELEFNNLLDIESKSWSYKQCSGGERQCIDLAILFALYDLNAVYYGRQCNVMVLDEVDSRLDPHYVDALASVIVDDFGKPSPTRPSTILTISHKDDMLDAFPTKIKVKKISGFSYAEIEK